MLGGELSDPERLGDGHQRTLSPIKGIKAPVTPYSFVGEKRRWKKKGTEGDLKLPPRFRALLFIFCFSFILPFPPHTSCSLISLF